MTSGPVLSDGELLRRAAAGESAAFSVLYVRYEAVVAGLLVRRGRDPELAADLTAETFAAAIVGAGGFRDAGQAALAWLLGIARNLSARSQERGRAERRARPRLGVEACTPTPSECWRSDGVTILVPTERVGRHDKGYRSSIRRQVLCVMTSVRRTPRTATVMDRGGKPTTIHAPGAIFAEQSCGGLRQLRPTGIGGATSSDTGFIYNALVRDGVARVVIRPRRHRTLTVPVRDHLYEANTGSDLPPARGLRWLDANGNTINHRRR